MQERLLGLNVGGGVGNISADEGVFYIFNGFTGG